MNGMLAPAEPIIIIDAFLRPESLPRCFSELTSLRNWRPEVDYPGAPPVGETCDLPKSSELHQAIGQELKTLFPVPWTVDRFYVNRFQPRDIPRFHQDGDVITCLFYPEPFDWHPNEHGETQILINREIRGILPLANRMLVFDGRLMHRATAFRSRRRYTVAAKLENVSFADIVLPNSG